MCVESDLGVEKFRNRTPSLRRLGRFVERLGSRAGNLGFQLQMTLGDREASVLLLQRDGARGLKARRLQPRFPKLRRKSHGEASGVRRSQQLLRVRALALLKAAVERIRCGCERAARGRDGSCAALQIA